MNFRHVQFGDVIFAHRTRYLIVNYDHYGVYVDSDHVIHFSDNDRDRAEIIETSLKTFVGPADGFSICHFPETSAGLRALVKSYERKHGVQSWFDQQDIEKYHLYSPQETVERARKELGHHAGEYNALLKNCEHFAVWCKTGITHSSQIDWLIGIIPDSGTELISTIL